jgi:hypothetical protein
MLYKRQNDDNIVYNRVYVSNVERNNIKKYLIEINKKIKYL